MDYFAAASFAQSVFRPKSRCLKLDTLPHLIKLLNLLQEAP